MYGHYNTIPLYTQTYMHSFEQSAPPFKVSDIARACFRTFGIVALNELDRCNCIDIQCIHRLVMHIRVSLQWKSSSLSIIKV